MRTALLTAFAACVAATGIIALTAYGQASPGAHVAAVPILAGPWSSGQEGYGHAKPSTVFNGGDPTGLIKKIEWLTWGGPRAVGVGSGFYVSPNEVTAEGHRAAAVIVAFKLGNCHHRPAYNAVQWYFPEYGQHFNPHEPGYKLCV